VNGVELASYTYCSVFVSLVQWVEQYVGRKHALTMVCSVMAQWFRLACNAYDTAQGPYGEIADMLMVQMVRHGAIDPLRTSEWPLTTLGIPSEDEICDIARLYAVVYHASVGCSWSLAEREEIYLWLRTTVPPIVGLDEGALIAVQYDLAPLPLRRAVEYFDNEQCGEQLVCVVAQKIWENEERAGLNWLRAVTR